MPEQPRPPGLAAAILNFFSHQQDFAAMAGDIQEEFQQRAEADGPDAARRWYRREALRNAWALTVREVMRTPVKTLLVVIASLLAMNFVGGLFFLLRILSQQNLFRILSSPLWPTILVLVQLGAPFAIGWAGGKILAGREWALALAFVALHVLLETGIYGYVRTLPRALPTPMVVAAILANTLRLAGFSAGCLWCRRSRLKAARA